MKSTRCTDLHNLERSSKLGLVDVPPSNHGLRILPTDEQIDHVADEGGFRFVVVAGVADAVEGSAPCWYRCLR